MQAWADTFANPNSLVVLAELKAKWQDRSSVEKIAGGDVAIYRMAVAEGARLAYLYIIDRVKEARGHGRTSDTADIELDDAIDAAGAILTEQ